MSKYSDDETLVNWYFVDSFSRLSDRAEPVFQLYNFWRMCKLVNCNFLGSSGPLHYQTGVYQGCTISSSAPESINLCRHCPNLLLRTLIPKIKNLNKLKWVRANCFKLSLNTLLYSNRIHLNFQNYNFSKNSQWQLKNWKWTS